MSKSYELPPEAESLLRDAVEELDTLRQALAVSESKLEIFYRCHEMATAQPTRGAPMSGGDGPYMAHTIRTYLTKQAMEKLAAESPEMVHDLPDPPKPMEAAVEVAADPHDF